MFASSDLCNGTCSSKSPLWALRAAKKRVDATGPRSTTPAESGKLASRSRKGLHINSDDFTLRVISVAIVFAGSIEEILDPEDVIEP